MKHRVKGRILGRVRKGRVALLKTLLGSLVIKERIITTEAKAKEIKPHMDRLISKASKISNDPASKVAVIRELRKNLPLVAVKKLTGEFLTQFGTRKSGFTRIIKLGQRRSDSAKMAVIEFV